MPYRPTQFHLTIIKPYYKDDSSEPLQNALKNALGDALEDALKNTPENAIKDTLEENHD